MTPQERFAGGEIEEAEMNRLLARRRLRQRLVRTGLIVGGAMVVFLLVWVFWPSGEKKANQRIELALSVLKDGFIKLVSRVEALENKPVPKVALKATITGGSSAVLKSFDGKLDKLVDRVDAFDRRLEQLEVAVETKQPAVPPVSASTAPPSAAVVDLTLIERGLGNIAESIRRQSGAGASALLPPPVVEPPSTDSSIDPCSN
ncbi:MAG: hypothetical protein Q7R60_00370, partial [bacterium]|nr:hypothetical protein [bacterium]